APNAQRAVVWEEAGGFGGTAGARLGVHNQLKPFLAWDLDDPGRFSFLELRGRLRADSLVRGERPWRSAKLILYFKDSQGRKHWDYSHSVANLTGSSGWQEYVKSFQVPEFAESAHVLAANSSASGTLWCDDIALRPVQLNPHYLLYRSGLLLLGAVFFAVLVLTTGIWRNGGWVPLVVGVVILIGVLCSQSILSTLADIALIDARVLKKAGHIILFAGLGFLSCGWVRKWARCEQDKGMRKRLFLLFIGLSCFAGITEFLQQVTFDRTASIMDLTIDAVGIVFGMGLAGTYRALRIYRKA
ncbi:MAG: VanZ family protein, partial [Deltaproteobacteria bacterium]|nr:VanZ family protein [Deltaproteobacteria bacterium]